MSRRWKSISELAAAIEARARSGRTVTLSAETAFQIASKLYTVDAKPTRDAIALMICRQKVKCSVGCFECTGRANVVVRAYGCPWERVENTKAPRGA